MLRQINICGYANKNLSLYKFIGKGVYRYHNSCYVY